MSKESSEEKKPTRRAFLATAVGAVVSAIVTGAGVYFLTPREVAPPETVTKTVEKTVTQTATVTQTVAGTPTPTPTPTPTVVGGIKDRAIEGAKKLIEQLKIPSGTKLRVMHPGGADGHYKQEYLAEWEEKTGIKIETVVVPLIDVYKKIITESVEKSGAYDVISVCPVVYMPDVVESGVAAQMDDWVKKYEPLIYDPVVGYPESFIRSEMSYKGRLYGFAVDYDVNLGHIREDSINDPNEKKAFESEFGYPLKAPETWKEFEDIAKFFYRPEDPNPVSGEKGLWGVWEYRVYGWSTPVFLARFLSKGKYYFDDNMKPNMDTPEAVEALKDQVRINQYLPPQVWTGDWTASYKLYADGGIVTMMSFTSLKKYSRIPDVSKLLAKGINVAAYLPPGEPVFGQIRRAGIQAWNHCHIASNFSKYPELAYCFNQFYTDPDVAAPWLNDPAGFYEPHRLANFDNPEVKKICYGGPEFLAVMLENFDYYAPDVALHGAGEYTDVLNRNLIAAWRESIDPETALRDIATSWEEITDRLGRDNQIQAWLKLKEGFGPKLRPLLK